jgi:hypothetical protein
MNKITLFSASAFCAVVCGTCATPDQAFVQQSKAFADMRDGSIPTSSGVKCSAVALEDIYDNKDSLSFNSHSGIVCVED